MIPNHIEAALRSKLSPEDYALVHEEVNKLLLEEPLTLPAPVFDQAQSEGDYDLGYRGEDYRPTTKLDFKKIKDMNRSGPTIFALEMKRAQIVSIFRNDKSWKIQCPVPELQEMVTRNLIRVFPKMSLDFSYSSLAFGVSFQELVWEKKTRYEMGLTDKRDNKQFIIAKVPAAINPETIAYIKRKKDGAFDGFIQRLKTPRDGKSEIEIKVTSGLVMPYNERFRDLWGESFYTPIYALWVWYDVVLRSMVRFMERMGTPVTVARAPSRGTVTKPGTNKVVNAMQWGLAVAGNVAKSNAIVIPSDVDSEHGQRQWDIEFLDTGDKSYPFTQALDTLNQMIMRAAIIADRAITQGSVGSYSLGEIHKEATYVHNEMILTQWVHYLNRYFIPYFALYNYGRQAPPIWLETQGLDPVERENMSQMMAIAGNFANFKEVGYMIDWRTMLATNNVPLLDEKAFQKLKSEYEQKEQEMTQQPQDQGAQDQGNEMDQAINALEEGRFPLIFTKDEVVKLTNRQPYTVKKNSQQKIYRTKDGREYYRVGGKFAGWVKGAERLRPQATKQRLNLLGGLLQSNPTMNPEQDMHGFIKSVNKSFDKGSSNPKVVACKDWNCVKQNTGVSNKNFLGAYMPGKNTMVITPSGAANKKLLKRTATHELIHGRKRSGGYISKLNGPEHVLMEEGLTDLLAHRVTGREYNYRKSPYFRQMSVMASVARRASGGDQKKAWQYVSDMHYYNDGPKAMKMLTQYVPQNRLKDTLKQGANNNDVDWLMGHTKWLEEPVNEEEAIEQLFARNEAIIWKEIRGIGNDGGLSDVSVPTARKSEKAVGQTSAENRGGGGNSLPAIQKQTRQKPSRSRNKKGRKSKLARD